MTLGEYISNFILLSPIFFFFYRFNVDQWDWFRFPLDFFPATVHFILSEIYPSSLAFCLASSKRCIEMSFSNNNTRIRPHFTFLCRIACKRQITAEWSIYSCLILIRWWHRVPISSLLNITEITCAVISATHAIVQNFFSQLCREFCDY